jgi:thioredoxin-like negative regulator of GroEL
LLFELEKKPELNKKLLILEIDVDKFSSLAQSSRFNVYSVPTIFLFEQGKIIKKFSGNLSVPQLKEFSGI